MKVTKKGGRKRRQIRKEEENRRYDIENNKERAMRI
jgi:hypothetical protein